MLRKYCCSIFLLVTINFIFALKINFENENFSYNLSPYQKEVEECENDILKCEHFSTYPRSLIKKLIKENVIKKEWFSGDQRKLTQTEVLKNEMSNNGTESLCEADVRTVYPQGKMTINQEFVYIVQMNLGKDHYYQAVHTETCKINKKTCRVRIDFDKSKELVPATNESITFTCFQEKSHENVIGITTNGTVVRATLIKNGCCACGYSSTKVNATN